MFLFSDEVTVRGQGIQKKEVLKCRAVAQIVSGSLLHQRFGAEYSSLSSAADCESPAEKPLKLRYNFIS